MSLPIILPLCVTANIYYIELSCIYMNIYECMDVYVSCLCFICLLLYNGSSMRICSLCVPSSQNSTWHITKPQIFIED